MFKKCFFLVFLCLSLVEMQAFCAEAKADDLTPFQRLMKEDYRNPMSFKDKQKAGVIRYSAGIKGNLRVRSSGYLAKSLEATAVSWRQWAAGELKKGQLKPHYKFGKARTRTEILFSYLHPTRYSAWHKAAHAKILERLKANDFIWLKDFFENDDGKRRPHPLILSPYARQKKSPNHYLRLGDLNFGFIHTWAESAEEAERAERAGSARNPLTKRMDFLVTQASINFGKLFNDSRTPIHEDREALEKYPELIRIALVPFKEGDFVRGNYMVAVPVNGIGEIDFDAINTRCGLGIIFTHSSDAASEHFVRLRQTELENAFTEIRKKSFTEDEHVVFNEDTEDEHVVFDEDTEDEHVVFDEDAFKQALAKYRWYASQATGYVRGSSAIAEFAEEILAKVAGYKLKRVGNWAASAFQTDQTDLNALLADDFEEFLAGYLCHTNLIEIPMDGSEEEG